MTLAITELELTPGLWRPDAKVICFDCHCEDMNGPVRGWGREGNFDAANYAERPLAEDSWEDVAVCDVCGKSIWMDVKIALEQKIVNALKDLDFVNVGMQQTGGMCSAAELWLESDEDGGMKYVWIVWDEEDRNDPKFAVGFFHIENPYGDDWEGEDGEVLPFTEAVDYAEKLYKAGRHVEP